MGDDVPGPVWTEISAEIHEFFKEIEFFEYKDMFLISKVEF
jgi:hypothetical protein